MLEFGVKIGAQKGRIGGSVEIDFQGVAVQKQGVFVVVDEDDEVAVGGNGGAPLFVMLVLL